MRQRPDSRELLAALRHALKEKLLPGVAPELRGELLMAINAAAIAQRELELGEQALIEEKRRLEALAPGEGASGLARRIRAGAADPGEAARGAIFDHLRQVVRDRLAHSNPRALPAQDAIKQ